MLLDQPYSTSLTQPVRLKHRSCVTFLVSVFRWPPMMKSIYLTELRALFSHWASLFLTSGIIYDIDNTGMVLPQCTGQPHAQPMHLHDAIHSTLCRLNKVSYDFPLCLRTAFYSVWFGFCLYFVSRDTLWGVYTTSEIILCRPIGSSRKSRMYPRTP